jgi:O-acetylserine/cysteine efflux transporter
VILVWAGSFPLGKLALREIGPLTLTGVRAVIAAPLLLLFARLSTPLARPLDRRDVLTFLVLGPSGPAGNATIWFWGLAATTALNAGILGASSPIFAAIAGVGQGGRLLGGRDRAGAAVARARRAVAGAGAGTSPARRWSAAGSTWRRGSARYFFRAGFGFGAAPPGRSCLMSPFTSSMNCWMSLNWR